MKITSRQYAQALIEAVADKDKKGAKSAIDNFIKLLAQNNDLKLADKICSQVKDIYNEQNRILDAEVISAKELRKKKDSVKEQIKSETGAKEINLKNIVDKNILGGMIIKYGDRILDSSLRSSLNDLREKMKK